MKDSNNKIRILGIDPGSLITGFGVIDTDGAHNIHVASGPIKIKGENLAERLKIIFQEISAIIQEHRPHVVAIEQVFMNRNADSALKLGQARGAAITAAAMLEIPVYEYTPRHVKQSVVGKGSASKEQVQHMVAILLNLQQKLQADEADALAIALCHGHIGGTMNKISQQEILPATRRKRR